MEHMVATSPAPAPVATTTAYLASFHRQWRTQARVAYDCTSIVRQLGHWLVGAGASLVHLSVRVVGVTVTAGTFNF